MADNITYTDKVTSQTLPNPATEKIQAADMNEIKSVVNTNASETDANTSAIAGKQDTSEKGVANGYASLDSGGQVPIAQLPAEVQGGIKVIGFWDADTNIPDLSALTLDQGEAYQVSVSGSTNLNGETNWKVKDLAVWSDALAGNWFKLDNTDDVTSVAGKTGAVTLDSSDVSGVLPLAGGTMTGSILGDVRARLFRAFVNSNYDNTTEDIADVDENSLHSINPTTGAVIIQATDGAASNFDASSSRPEFEFFARDISNSITFAATGSQTIISKGSALGITEVGQAVVFKYIGSDTWLLVGAS